MSENSLVISSLSQSRQKFVIFKLGDKRKAAILVANISEVFKISLSSILLVPEVPACVLGIYNWRGEMLWWIDLEHLLGFEPIAVGKNALSTHMAIVIQAQGKYLGLLVRELIDIEFLDRQKMNPPGVGLFSPQLLPFLQGYFMDDHGGSILNLDAIAIIQSPLWSIKH